MRGRWGGAWHDSEAEASGSSDGEGKTGVSARHCPGPGWSLGRMISLALLFGPRGFELFSVGCFLRQNMNN
jgi:hypothetical protein